MCEYTPEAVERLLEIEATISKIKARTAVDDDWGYQYTDADETAVEDLEAEARGINRLESARILDK